MLQKNHCFSVCVPNNHTDLIQPLDSSVSKGVKSFLTDKYQEWYAQQVTAQLNRGVSPHDVNVELSVVKPLHARWIIQYYRNMQNSKLPILSGFRKAHITAAVNEAKALARLSENPFEDIDLIAS